MMPLMILRCAWAGVALMAQAVTIAMQMVETEPANPVRSMNTPNSVKMRKNCWHTNTIADYRQEDEAADVCSLIEH